MMISCSRNTGKRTRSKLVLGMIWLIHCFLMAGNSYAQRPVNDHIFPASAGAKPYIDFDSRGFLINGRREFLVSAGMEYARVPRELWQDRLLRLKRDGFNCIEIYTFWNYHEPQEGKFNFNGNHDLDAFLKLAKKMGMYVIARVGPYYCAEWTDGGYPLWLRFKPNLRVREDNTTFEKYTDLFWDTLMPIVCRNQINHGGSVIMVQLENEHPDGWGTSMPNGYFRHLRNKALSLGLEVPYFFSGLHHSSNPAGKGNLDDPDRPNPWMSTEFWAGWFNGYSSTEKEARIYERRTWRIIANGGNGYNYYMAHGGSNFGYTNNDEDAASYDYGAAVGQGGDLRPIYYRFKRTALFARSFQNILENSSNANDLYRNICTGASLHVTARKSAAGDIIFLDNPADSSTETLIRLQEDQGTPVNESVTLGPGEIFPIVHDFKINTVITLQWSLARILGISREGNTSTVVVYGKPGTSAELSFNTTGKTTLHNGKDAFSVSGHGIKLHAKFTDAGEPAIYSFTADDQKICILVVNEDLSDRTWFIEQNGEKYIVCGPYYAGRLEMQNRKISLSTEIPWLKNDEPESWIFHSSELIPLKPVSDQKQERITSLALSSWQTKDETGAARPDFDDRNWKKSRDPLQMGADGDISPDAWYRTPVYIDHTGVYSLQVKGGDRAIVFIDGKPEASVNIKDKEIILNLTQGKHLLAIFTAHDGRDKLAGFLGAPGLAAAKGLYGKVLLVKGRGMNQNLTDWQFLKAASMKDLDQWPPAENADGWEKYTIGKDVFNHKEGFGWFRTTLPDPPADVKQIQLEFRSVDENATVFVNGIKLGKHTGWNIPFNFTINRADSLKKPIILTLFIENYSNEGGIDQTVHADYLLPSTRILTGWRMHGGIPDPEKIRDWKACSEKNETEGPCFFRSSFNFSVRANSNAVYRVTITGLGHGSIWVNGHNLGRYPEKIPVNGLYIPSCWMKNGSNDLYIYDEDGKYPARVSIEAETAASRDILSLSAF